MNVSLDGFIAAPDGSLDWTAVDDELHTWFNDHARSMSASLYGRRLYDTMAAYWPTASGDPDATGPMLEFAAIWNRTPRYVFSRTLDHVEHNSQLVRDVDIGQALAAIRDDVDGDIEIGGADLAHQFIRRGLVDEFRPVVHPVVLGAGIRFLPDTDEPLRLELFETRRFASGVVYLGYRVVRRPRDPSVS